MENSLVLRRRHFTGRVGRCTPVLSARRSQEQESGSSIRLRGVFLYDSYEGRFVGIDET